MKILSKTLNSSIYLSGDKVHKIIEGPFEINGFPELLMINLINYYIGINDAPKPNLVEYEVITNNTSIIFSTKKYAMNLDEYIQTIRYGVQDIKRMLSQIGYAIAWLHAHHILHRDIKGGNIFVDEYGDFYLGDFGSSKYGPCNTDDRTTKYYEAPELIDNPTSYTTQSDIFALGVCIFVMQHKRYPIKELPKSTDKYHQLLTKVMKFMAINDYMEPNPLLRKQLSTRFSVELSAVKNPLSIDRQIIYDRLIALKISPPICNYLTSIYFDTTDQIEQYMQDIPTSEMIKLAHFTLST